MTPESFLTLSATWQDKKHNKTKQKQKPHTTPRSYFFAKSVTALIFASSASRAGHNRSLLSVFQPTCLFWFHSLSGLNAWTKSISKLCQFMSKLYLAPTEFTVSSEKEDSQYTRCNWFITKSFARMKEGSGVKVTNPGGYSNKWVFSKDLERKRTQLHGWFWGSILQSVTPQKK